MVDAAENSIDVAYFGNPVFDITIQDDEKTVINKYGLELGMACLATPEQKPIYVESYAREDKILTPGGSALNSARAQKHVNSAQSVSYFGCIGNDVQGQALTEAVSAAGIEAKLEVTESEPTSLCASIEAAKKFSMDYLNANMVSRHSKFSS